MVNQTKAKKPVTIGLPQTYTDELGDAAATKARELNMAAQEIEKAEAEKAEKSRKKKEQLEKKIKKVAKDPKKKAELAKEEAARKADEVEKAL